MAKNFALEITDGNINKSIVQFFSSLLEKGLIDALLIPKELPNKENVVQTLTTNSTEEINPFAPVMPVNSASIISDMTGIKPSDKRIAVVLRACEIRALIELVKLLQASLENLIIIGVDCPGTFSVNDYKEMIKRQKNPTREILDAIKNNKELEGLRSACQACEYYIPENTDITIGLFGTNLDKQILIQTNSDAGQGIIEKLGLGSYGDTSTRDKVIAEITQRRIKKREQLFSETQKEVAGLDNLLNYFTTCIACHNCMKVCPICYCKQCLFESVTFEYEFNQYFRQVAKKKSVRMPVDTVLFHLGRMNHMVASCVACGMCEQACPSKIELLKIFKFVGDRVQKVFDYVPGRNLKEELPIATFKEEELEPR